MQILTKQRIIDLMQFEDSKEIASDGWSDIKFTSNFDENPPSSMHQFKRQITSTYQLRLFSSMTVVASGDWNEEVVRHCSKAMHTELYGDIIRRLHFLSSRVERGNKDEVRDILHELIEDLG